MKVLHFIFLFTLSVSVISPQVIINKKNAEVWGTQQLIYGRVDSFYAGTGNLFVNGIPETFSISAADSTFLVNTEIDEGINNIYAEVTVQTVILQCLIIPMNCRGPSCFAVR